MYAKLVRVSAVVFATMVLVVPGTASASTSRVAAPARSCHLLTGGHLQCDNRPGAKAYADRSYKSAVRGVLTSSNSYFECWGHGDMHSGGNDIWYWTQTDDTSMWGNVAAVDVYTPQDPYPGMKQC